MSEQCQECQEYDGSHIIGCPVRTQHLKHEGHLFERTERCKKEKAFSEVWKEINTPQYSINGGYISLEHILLPQLYPGNPLQFNPLKGELTERDCLVAASVIQWLGTNCGQGFLERVKRLCL